MAKNEKPSETQAGGASAGSGNAQEIIEARRKAKEEAVDQTGVTPPEVDPHAGLDTTLGKPE